MLILYSNEKSLRNLLATAEVNKNDSSRLVIMTSKCTKTRFWQVREAQQ